MTGITRQLGAFVASLHYRDLPEICREAARIGMTDCIGVMIAGAHEEAPRIVSRMVLDSGRLAHAPQIPSGRRLSQIDAALVNGVAAHVLDYDDVALSGHPSAVLVPAILASGHAAGAGGEAAITAYVAGYETWAQLQALEPGQLHDRGFHPTAVLGAVGAAAACASLRGLDAEATAGALALAASLASGLVANFGTMTKPLHVGRAAQAGVLAAELTFEGFTSSLDAIEHRAGFLAAHSPSGRPTLDAELDIGCSWRLATTGVNVKRYPTCYATHRAIDAMLGLVVAHDLDPSGVARIHVHTGGTQHRMLRHSAPRSALSAKFSMEFAMVAALLERRVSLAELSHSFVLRPDVQRAFGMVAISTTEEQMVDDETFAPFDQVTVELKSGVLLEHPPVVRAKGSWAVPLSIEEREAKFLACVAPVLGSQQADALWGALQQLDRLPAIADLPLIQTYARLDMSSAPPRRS